jgi:hypothetical protein
MIKNIFQLSMKRYIFSIIITIHFVGIVLAQSNQQQMNALYVQFSKDSTKIYKTKKILPLLAIDQRTSFINHTKVSINGFQLGVALNEKHNFGLGFYKITDNTRHSKIVSDQTIKYNLTVNLSYATLFYYYPFFDKRFLEVGVSGEIGAGYYNVDVTNATTGKSIKGYPKPNLGMGVGGAGLSITFKPLVWIGFNVMGGYRYILDPKSNLNLNGVYFSWGVIMNTRRILQDFKYLRKKFILHKEIKKLNF